MGAIKDYYFDEIVEGLEKTGTTSSKTSSELYLEGKRIECRISYYEEKIKQFRYLESISEEYGELDHRMVEDWELAVKELKKDLEKLKTKN